MTRARGAPAAAGPLPPLLLAAAALAVALPVGLAQGSESANVSAIAGEDLEPSAVVWTPRAPLPAPLSDFSATRVRARSASPYSTAAADAGSGGDYLIAIVGGCDGDQSLVCEDEDAQAGCFFVCPHATDAVALYHPAMDKYFVSESEAAPGSGTNDTAMSGAEGENGSSDDGTAVGASAGTVARAPVARLRHAAAAVLGGELLVVAGGRTADTDELITAIDVFNASSGTWAEPSPITNWTGATSDLGMFALDDWPAPGVATAVALAGYDAGYEALPDAQEFVLAPASDLSSVLPPGTEVLSTSEPFTVGGAGAPALALAWVRMPAQAGGVPDLPDAGRGDITVAQAPPVEEGVQAMAVAIGGYVAGDFCSPVATVDAFVPFPTVAAATSSAGVWVSLPPLTHPRADAAAGWADGRLFVAGGEGTRECAEFSLATDHVEEWTPPVDSLLNASNASLAAWRDAGDFPDERFRFAGASTESALFLFGGQAKFDEASGTYPLTEDVVEFQEGCPSLSGSGDVNGDSQVDLTDLQEAAKHVASALIPKCVLFAADLDANGVLDAADLAMLQIIVQE